MTQYNGIFSATSDSDAFSAAGSIIELQVPAATRIEILRAWVGPAEGTDPVSEVQEISLYVNDGPATAGTALTEQELRGSTDATSAVAALAAPTIAATPVDLIFDAFHVQNGWLYLPVPEERVTIMGGTTNDNVGLRFPVAPDASMTFSYGMIWGELG
jgi:hypothetical protein